MYLHFVRCRKEDEFQRRLTGLFADICSRPDVPIVVATDLLVLPDDLGRLYFLASRAYWA